jgi:cholesterol oxidase
MSQSDHFDAIVVGSGFGGSVVADRLVEDGWSVCVLERGRAYKPGEFPRSPSEMKEAFWDPSEDLYGLFDVWSFSGLAAVVASGLGGGSLVYANVLQRPDEAWLTIEDPVDGSQRPWPVTLDELEPHFEAVEDVLEPVQFPAGPPLAPNPKTVAFRRAAHEAGLELEPIGLGVRFEDDRGAIGRRRPFGDPHDNYHNVQRLTCEMLGECDLGCNLGAKNTLDLTYLSRIRDRAEIRTHADVRAFRVLDGGFEVSYLVHRPGDDAPPETEKATCRRLVLAAGTLGTVLLLLRSRIALPGLSRRVGHGFSANGDYLAFACDCGSNGSRIDAWRGPVITSSARSPDVREGDGRGDGPGFHIQDGGFPSWAGWVSQVGGIKRNVMRAEMQIRHVIQGQLRGAPDENISKELSELLGDGGARLLPLLTVGRDIPAGRLRLRGRRLDIDWRKDESAALYERTEAAARRVADRLDGRYVDPLKLVRPITVHPLGGCAMSKDPTNGVVSPEGQVYGVPNLSIADGSVLPGPVGINPALTIAALAHRHAEHLIKEGHS